MPFVRRSIAAVLLAATASAVAATPAATAPTTKPDMTPRVAENTVRSADVPYVASAAAKQTLDVYAPRGVRGAPVVLFVHGGEWTKGDKTEVSYKPQFFNSHGVIFAAANYRLNPGDSHPAQVDDVAAAVRYVYDHAMDYGGDRHKIVLLGHSAGCHLVTLVAVDARPLAVVGLKPSDLAAVVSWSGGAFDLPEKVRAGGTYAGYIRANFGPDESAWRDASPVAHVADPANKPLPPFLFASADRGKPESRAAAEHMAELVRSTGGRADTLLLEDRDHTGANHLLGAPGDRTGPALLHFIDTVVSTQPSARKG